MAPIDQILDRLEKVKEVRSKDGVKWKACCPAHDDKTPSLMLTETADGTVLLKCWVGCSADEIVRAIGLELRDLFPGKQSRRHGPSPAAVRHERTVYLIGKSLLERGSQMSAEDQERFELAKQRLGAE